MAIAYNYKDVSSGKPPFSGAMVLNRPIPSEQQAIRSRCSDKVGDFSEFPPAATDGSILERFGQMVRNFPHRVAVKTRTHELTYEQLDQETNRVAHAILRSSPDIAAPIGLLFENGARYVIASLGALKAGGIQVSLESAFPKSRLDHLLAQSQAALLVTDNQNLSLARLLRPLTLLNIDDLDGSFEITAPAREVGADAVVAIDYSSGSTGQPKGIVWNHRTVLHVVARHTNTSRIGLHDRLAMSRAGLRAYLLVLLNGGTFYPIDPQHQAPTDLATWLNKEEITIYRCAVSTFRSLTAVLTESDTFQNLRLILLFGEAVYQRDVEIYRQRFSDDCILSSSLGCNEIDDFAYFFVDKNVAIPGGVLPAGYPVADVDVLLLDENGYKVGPDQIGEICIRCPHSPNEYWRQPELTGAAFVKDPDGSDLRVYRTGDLGRMDDTGCLFQLGRKDFQVKIRGYQVNVAEVEAALLEFDELKQAAVVGRHDKAGNSRLIAYLVPEGSRLPQISEFRRFLSERVAEYAVPSIFVVVNRLPLTATGKIDRRALPSPDGARPVLETPFVGPRTLIEEKLATIWAEVLELNEIGVFDNFLELGGDSLRAVQVIARVMDRFQVRPPVSELMEAPTVAEMALVILESQAAAIEKSELDDLLSQLSALSEDETRALLGRRDG
jgi:acyl-coenzyme A synthetase/AMP-(fatty) acid ligase/acyl carrier protein